MDRKKAQEQALIEIAKEGIKAAGVAIEGGFAGLGLAMQGYLSGDAVAFGAKSVAGLLFLEWLIAAYPNFARTTHLDSLSLTHAAGQLTQLPPSPSANGKFCFRATGFNNETVDQCYETAQDRDVVVAFGVANHRIINVVEYDKS